MTDGINYSKKFKKITSLLDMLDETGDCDPSLTGEIRENFAALAYNVSYIDARLNVTNLSFFMMKLEEIFAAKREGEFAACLFNIRGTNSMNRTIGYDNVTFLMSRFFRGLQSISGEDGVVCAIGGDVGAVFFKKDRMDLILDYLRETKVIYDDASGENVAVHAVAGVNPSLDKCSTKYEVMDSIGPTLGIAKSMRSVNVLFFDDNFRVQMKERAKIESIFPIALENREFHIFFQPKVRLSDYAVCGAEALCRWKRDGKILPPASFIPVLEQNNTICDLDFYIIESVCQTIRGWIDSGRNPVQVSINLSKNNLNDEHVAEKIVALADKYGIPHSLLQIEIKEETASVNFAALKKVIAALSEAGVSCAVDDFGSDYASLNLLIEVPWNVVKIDRSILHNRRFSDAVDHDLFAMIVSFARTMGLECVAEGAESLEDLQFLKKVNCNVVQGYYFDFPLESSAFEKKLTLSAAGREAQAIFLG